LEAGALPSTEEDSNWTVAVFRCPRRNWTETLSNLFSELDKQKLALMPHYTLRAFDPLTNSLIVSFRILRKQEHEKPIKDLVEKLLKDHEHEFDPRGQTRFAQYHAWGSLVGWTREKCEILSKMSRLVLDIIRSDTSRDDKEQWTHLFSNMAVVFDLLKIYQSPETILNPDATPYRVLRYG
jgi:hypothetical protein